MNKNRPSVPVMMCVWRRPHLLQRTIDQLAGQFHVQPRLYLWNNNRLLQEEIDRTIAENRHRLPIEVHHHHFNIGCFGRFMHAQPLLEQFPFFVIIDDDQQFDDDFLWKLWNDRIPGGVAASYARGFIRNEQYWERRDLEFGEKANYTGPGGMIIDARLLADPRLLQCPEEYWMCDDIWISYLLDHLIGAPMKRSSAVVKMTDIPNDTFHSLRQTKVDFLEELRRSGWAA